MLIFVRTRRLVSKFLCKVKCHCLLILYSDLWTMFFYRCS